MDDVITHLGREGAAIMRAAAQLGQYLAYMQRERLVRLEQHSRLEAARMREVMDMERRMAAPIYMKLMRDSFWNNTDLNEIAHAYGLSRRFTHLDPMAVLAAREAEKRARDMWGVDLRAMNEPAPTIDELPAQAVPTVGEEHADHLRAQIALREAERERAQETRAHTHLEDAHAAEAETRANTAWDQAWERVVAEHPDASRWDHILLTQEALTAEDARATWDTRQARAAHTKEAIEAGASTQAARAALTADTSHSTPPHTAVKPKRKTHTASRALANTNTAVLRRAL